MITIHRGTGVRLTDEPDAPVARGHAVAVDGARIDAIGPFAQLSAAYGERARVREWAGVIGPGRHAADAAALLEEAYVPDPREAAELGTEPLTGDALAALAMTESRWGGSARRALQRLLATGTTSLSGDFRRPAVRTAVRRSPIRHLPRGPVGPRALAVPGPADFAVLADDGTCLATVLDGRLLYRRG